MKREFLIGPRIHLDGGLVDDRLVAAPLRIDEIVLHHVEHGEEERDEAQTEFGRVSEDRPNVRSIYRDQNHLKKRKKNRLLGKCF